MAEMDRHQLGTILNHKVIGYQVGAGWSETTCWLIVEERQDRREGSTCLRYRTLHWGQCFKNRLFIPAASFRALSCAEEEEKEERRIRVRKIHATTSVWIHVGMDKINESSIATKNILKTHRAARVNTQPS